MVANLRYEGRKSRAEAVEYLIERINRLERDPATPSVEIMQIFEWLLGYTTFPQREEGEGAYYWRTHLRKKLSALGIEIQK